MADIRSMLRAERAARSGPQQPRKAAKPAPPPAPAASKKRKPEPADDQVEEAARKRAKGPASDALPQGFFDDGVSRRDASGEHDTAVEADKPAEPAPISAAPQPPPQDVQTTAPADIDEDEWAAFERDVASPPPERSRLAAINAAATIEAKPMTAEELAAQAREEQSKQRTKQEEELEAEKEDAVRHLEEEFDEMDELEQRVRKLREQREALRRATEPGGEDATTEPDSAPAQTHEEDEDEEDDDEDDFDDFDDWRFRGS
ncbi:hypothetical protein HDK90DRAFT_265909 [Phyllosticta capitalensis]|uniref:Uncharacterized protein n=1 Tax=Phyllosticta capitalensis TaxID=121624 RepID=A0ABR1YLR3_9PEZI